MSLTENQLKCLEIDLIRNQENTYEGAGDGEFFQYVLDAKYESVLNHSVAEKILKNSATDSNSLDKILKENVENFFADIAENDQSKNELELLCVAVSCLQLFVQNNWTGPVLQGSPTQYLPEIFSSQEESTKLHNYVLEELSSDGEPVYDKCLWIELVFVARYLLLDCKEYMRNLQALSVRDQQIGELQFADYDTFAGMLLLTQLKLQTADWWLLRCLAVQQQLLDDRCPTLKEKILELVDIISKLEPLLADDKNRDLTIQFHLEAGYYILYYYESDMANEHFMTAKKMAGLSIELSGAMGKRTRYQQDAKAQLVLRVQKESSPTSSENQVVSESSEKMVLPKDLQLNDDTVLEAIKFEVEETFADRLSALDQATVVAVMENYRRSHANHEKLTVEELEAYLSCILSQVSCWSTSVHCLCLRSSIQKNSSRRVERSLTQLEELVNQLTRPEPSAKHRLHLFYSLQVQPSWMVKKQLAELFLSLGAVGCALDVFEELQMWEDVISCYKRLGKMEKAESVIREQLAIKETPSLWCYLGDVTMDISHYEKAWEMSKHRSARAMRCMAYHYFNRQEYEKSMECFEKSLSINYLQVPVWFTYGCTALTAKQFEKAVKAFKRCVNIDFDNFEAWNNMASAYVQLKEKKKALRVLMEAVKYNYENWRVWENIMVVATDCGDISEAIHAYNRLIDLKDKWVDAEVLTTLVKAVTGEYSDKSGKPAAKHAPKLLTLFGRITAKVTNEAEIWKGYAQLTAFTMEGKEEKQEMVLQHLQKAYRCVTQDAKWEYTTDRCKEVADQALELAERYEECISKLENSTKALQMLSSAKLMVKGVFTKIKKQHFDEVTDILDESVAEHCTKLEVKLQEITAKMTELKGS